MDRTAKLAEQIADHFYRKEGWEDSDRKDIPSKPYDEMFEVAAVNELRKELRKRGISGKETDKEIRLFLTFTAAMERSANSKKIWEGSRKLFAENRKLFKPEEIRKMEIKDIQENLQENEIGRWHEPDAKAWHTIGCTLAKKTERSNPVWCVIATGAGDAKELLRDLWRTDDNDKARFPSLRGPKISQMWVRMMADPGGARIDNLDWIRVAVDTHVRHVTEKLGVTDTEDMSLDVARGEIQSAWKGAVANSQGNGPNGEHISQARFLILRSGSLAGMVAVIVRKRA